MLNDIESRLLKALNQQLQEMLRGKRVELDDNMIEIGVNSVIFVQVVSCRF
jgi:hypothetical protein